MMVKAWQTASFLLGVWAVAQAFFNAPVEAQLSPSFYQKTCPQVFGIVAKGVHSAIQTETRNAASLLRMHFHDCFVQGCDASILLDGTPNNPSEKTAVPNLNSVRGFDIIASIKASLESSCPGVVSCADIVTLAAFFSIVLSGGPAWAVPLGRRDSFLPNLNETNNLPSPFADITTLKQQFAFQNLTNTDLVSLSGAHTIGLARCVAVTPRIYNFSTSVPADPSLNKTRLTTLKKSCPFNGDGNVTNPMDITTPTVFDNLYYKNLLLANGLFESDQELYNSASDTKKLVQLYASDQTKFFEDFAASIIKMGNLNVLTGKAGEIRKNCSVRNPTVKSIVEEVVNMESERGNERTITVENTGTDEKTESAVEFFKQVVKKVVEEVIGEELEKLVEETVTGGHAYMLSL